MLRDFAWASRTAGVVVLVLIVAGGCAASSRASSVGSLASISESLDESTSAAATAELVVELYADGQIPAVTADAALEDAVSAADAAVHSLTTIVVPDDETLAVQDSALTAAQNATRAVVATRVWVGSGDPRASAAIRTALEESGSGLETMTDRVDSLLEGGAS